MTAPIILCSRPLWLRRLLFSTWKGKGMVFINRTSIAVLCYIEYWSAGQWIQFTIYWSTESSSPNAVDPISIQTATRATEDQLCWVRYSVLVLLSLCSGRVYLTLFQPSHLPPPGPHLQLACLSVCLTQWPQSAIFLLNLLLFLHCWQKYVKSVHWKNSNGPSQSVRIKSVLYFLNLEKNQSLVRCSS